MGPILGKQKLKGKSRKPILGPIFGDPLWGKLRKSDRSFLYVLEHLAFSSVEPATVFVRCVHQRNLHLIKRASIENGSKNIWMFPKIGIPQNGWCRIENLIKMDDLGGKTPILGNIHHIFQLPINFRVTQISNCPEAKTPKIWPWGLREAVARGQVCLCAIHLGQGY